MRLIIFANGIIPTLTLPLPEHNLLVAADGGARNAARFGLIPDVLIGDFDSLAPEEVDVYAAAGASLFRHPADKDETDLELALDFALRSEASEVTLYGLFGGRWDMSFANLLLLASPKYAGLRLEIVEGPDRMHILRGGQSLEIAGTPGDRVSVIPLSGPAGGLSYEGLAWPLTNAELPFGSPRGVSNQMAAGKAKVSIKQGVILIVVSPGEPDDASKGKQ